MSSTPATSTPPLSLAPLTDERDIQRVAALEAASYPEDEAASETGIRFRQQHAGAFFQVARVGGDTQLVGFVNGTLSKGEQLEHESMSAHDPDGSLLCIHSVVCGHVVQGWYWTLPIWRRALLCVQVVDGAFRRRGIASAMLKQYVRYVCEQQVRRPRSVGRLEDPAQWLTRRLVHGPPSPTHQTQVKRIAMIAKAYLIGFYVSCGFAVTKLSPVVHGKDPWFELVLDCETARQIPLVQVDAFTSEPFQGNPAAVALLSAAQFHSKNAPKWMQRVALENNLAETAFVAPRESAGDSGVVEFDLKWFKPGASARLFDSDPGQ